MTDNEEMDQLVWSVLTQGLLTPLVVRPLPNGEYEVVSEHRRLHACKKAGIETVPALITELDRDEAAIALVNSNLHRESILPSEKTFAYKMKIEAMKHQGTSRQLGEKWSVTQLSEAGEDSERQIHRYIRLTHLLPELLQKVDEGQIAFTPVLKQQLRECETSIRNVMEAIQQGIITEATKECLEGLEAQRECLKTNILQVQMERRKFAKEEIVVWISKYKYGNINDSDYRKEIIDTFVNSVYVYEDKIVLTYNYKDGSQTLTL